MQISSAQQMRHRPSEIDVTLPPLWPYQREFTDDPTRYSVCVSATKTGKTTACAWWCALQAMDHPGTLWWWIGPTLDMGIVGYRNVQSLLGPAVMRTTERPYITRLWNGSTVVLKTAQEPEHLRGAGVSGAVLDEAGTPTYDEAWSVIRTTITATKGPLKIIGNPGDRGGFFWRAVGWGKDPAQPRWSYRHWNFMDRPTATQEELDAARAELGEDSPDFKRYYLGQFVDEEGAFFSRVVEAATAQPADPHIGAEYIIGVDPAIKSDFFVATVLRDSVYTMGGHQGARAQVHISRHKGPPKNQQAMEVKRLSDRYNRAQVVIEVNGPGEAIYQDLLNAGVPVRPFETTGKSKGDILHQLQRDIGTGQIKLLSHGVQTHELEQFQCYRTKTGGLKYGAPMGEHDDTVMALAIANNGLRRMVSAGVYYL